MLLDYDGTLRAFELDPRAAAPDMRLRDLLANLAATATLYLVSGRTAETLDNWFGDLGIGLVCEHGLAVKPPRGKWQRRVAVKRAPLRRFVEPVMRDFVRRTPGSSLEMKSAGMVFHYRAAEPEFGAFQANLLLSVLEDALKRRPYVVLRGARIIEVRHHRVSKGRALAHLLRVHRDADLLFCAGDDRTDEEMLEAIPRSWLARAITCWVGSRSAIARYWVESSADLVEELDSWVKLRGRYRGTALLSAHRVPV
jgi:trehalose 6-phosphate synthase/phosphatase